MSDPVTNVEIEDVLSSIRRLVSEGEKAKRTAPAPVEEKAPEPERLVLTPALRVKNDESEDQPAAEETLVFVTPDPLPETDSTPKAVAVDPESPEISQTAETEVIFDRARLEQSEVPFDRASLEATIAELEAAVTEQPDDWEPDGSEVVADTDLDPTWAQAGFASDQPVEDAVEMDDSPEAPETMAEVPVVEQPLAQDAPDGDDAAAATFSHSAIEQVATESVVDALADHIAAEAGAAMAPEDTTGDDTTLPPLTFRHSGEAVQDADDDFGDDLRDADTPEDELEAFLSDDAVIDESALRQMVLEIVREELQGRLGERITQNVRKLVRREIHRVLTSQDLE